MSLNGDSMRKLIGYLGILMILSIFITGFIAYFIFKYDPQTGITYDGLGRQLTESPLLMQYIFNEDRLWAGWKWFFADMVIFWGIFGIGGWLVSLGFSKIEEKNNERKLKL